MQDAVECVSLVIPVYNEASHLLKFLKTIDDIDLGLQKELVIIDDGSTDNSAHIIKSFAFKSQVQIVFNQKNRGKGSSIIAGISCAKGTIIGIQDSDFEYDPSEISKVIAPILSGKADACFGSRFKKSNVQVFRTFHYVINRILTLLSNIFSGLYLSDMETCYKFFRQDLVKGFNLKSARFGIEAELTAKLAQTKARVHEIPISYAPRTYKEGKKIKWQDGLVAIWHVVYFNALEPKYRRFNSNLPDKYKSVGKQWL